MKKIAKQQKNYYYYNNIIFLQDGSAIRIRRTIKLKNIRLPIDNYDKHYLATLKPESIDYFQNIRLFNQKFFK